MWTGHHLLSVHTRLLHSIIALELKYAGTKRKRVFNLVGALWWSSWVYFIDDITEFVLCELLQLEAYQVAGILGLQSTRSVLTKARRRKIVIPWWTSSSAEHDRVWHLWCWLKITVSVSYFRCFRSSAYSFEMAAKCNELRMLQQYGLGLLLGHRPGRESSAVVQLGQLHTSSYGW